MKQFVNLTPHILNIICLLYTSDAADDLLCVDLGGRRIIKKKNQTISGLTLYHESFTVFSSTS